MLYYMNNTYEKDKDHHYTQNGFKLGDLVTYHQFTCQVTVIDGLSDCMVIESTLSPACGSVTVRLSDTEVNPFIKTKELLLFPTTWAKEQHNTINL